MDAMAVRLAQQVSERAVDWLGRLRGRFALDREVPEHEISGESLKALGELALVASVVIREAVAGPRSAGTARSLLDFAWREFDEGALLWRLQSHTPGATHAMEFYSHFVPVGYRHPGLDRLAGTVLGTRAARVVEHVPSRRLAVWAAARRIGVQPPSAASELIDRTWLGGTPEPWMMDADNAHGVTHTVFHLTDWGDDPAGLPEPLHAYVRRWLPVWVEVFRETRFWDLLLEFLMVGACLPEPMLFPTVWKEVTEAQHADGMLPNSLTTPPMEPERAWANHHPTIVAAVAGTLTVSRALSTATTGGSRA
ncbi:hypothetical protein E1265_04365 [Streptomyces sp. 8K308]|uniref:DUF6895 family protein n=1 Tax=Streptomyces sp. 8K308 TaxID=2530388 RepID=UPI00104B8206|nr:hypothetical protein [Streptomyces sp. 8K308]TDC26412.1 hypothetical protein E1265_04365 [Streptomyces sp. 8K308]